MEEDKNLQELKDEDLLGVAGGIGQDDEEEPEESDNFVGLGMRNDESLESALRRFKRHTSRDGVLPEQRKREHYEKPSVKRKKKAEAARKRKY